MHGFCRETIYIAHLKWTEIEIITVIGRWYSVNKIFGFSCFLVYTDTPGVTIGLEI